MFSNALEKHIESIQNNNDILDSNTEIDDDDDENSSITGPSYSSLSNASESNLVISESLDSDSEMDDANSTVTSPSFSPLSTNETSHSATSDSNNDMLAESPVQLPNGEYIVEALRTHRLVRGRREFFVKWYGYGDLDNTWEPESALENCATLVHKYLEKYPSQIPYTLPRRVGASSQTTHNRKTKIG